MKTRALLILCLLFGGCGIKPMTNDEVIAETKKCREADMGIATEYRGLSNSITGIVCLPRRFEK